MSLVQALVVKRVLEVLENINKMSVLRPKIPELFSEIIATSEVKLDNYPADYTKYDVIREYSTKDTKDLARNMLSDSVSKLEELQEKLWASKKYGILIVLQGMDTAGKDGAIRHVMRRVNPQGYRVASFKVPTPLEASHDYLWRCGLHLPARGEIVVFNRSHYEAVLVTKVHPDVLEDLPSGLNLQDNKNFWSNRYKDINAFEKHLARNGTLILKFFLNISYDEQKKRLLERLTNEDKYWKISEADFKERKYWDNYKLAYEDMLSVTSKDYAPWLIVPANNKPVARAIIASVLSSAIEQLEPDFPSVSEDQVKKFKQIKKQLEEEKF